MMLGRVEEEDGKRSRKLFAGSVSAGIADKTPGKHFSGQPATASSDRSRENTHIWLEQATLSIRDKSSRELIVALA
jgi:hypothetical protein